MHTTQLTHMTFHHNGDYSGDVIIFTEDGQQLSLEFSDISHLALTIPEDVEEVPVAWRNASGTAVEYPTCVTDLRALCGERIRHERIAQLEQQDASALFADGWNREVIGWASGWRSKS